MEISFTEQFKKAYQKRLKGDAVSEDAFKRSLEAFILNPFDPRLKTHKLSGKLDGLWSFSVRYDVRVVFYFPQEKPPKAIFINIGDHDEVY
jgi:mRNA-degrading endonuclease YafQ of YafQ-DinJ toxin-antitoxin module